MIILSHYRFSSSSSKRILISLSAFSFTIQATELESETNQQQPEAAVLSSGTSQSDATTKNSGEAIFSFLGGPAYMPETGLMLAAGGLYSFKTAPKDEELQRSSITFVAVVNEMEEDLGVGLRSKHKIFFARDKIRLTGQLNMGRQSNYYWGIGYEAGQGSLPSDDLSVEFELVNYDADLTFKAAENLYIGPSIQVNYANPNQESLPQSAIDDDNFQEFKDKPFSLGIGVTFQWDSRDVAVNAHSGSFYTFDYSNFSENLGSDSEYEKVVMEARHYFTPQVGSTIAFKNSIEGAEGDVPYYDMPMIGGQDSMRGLYQGHYRDNYVVEHTAEYRHSFFNSNNQRSKHGAVIWGGIASIAPEIDVLYSDIVTTYGIGYRYELQPRMNVRVDLGFSPNNENGFYLSFNEAF